MTKISREEKSSLQGKKIISWEERCESACDQPNNKASTSIELVFDDGS